MIVRWPFRAGLFTWLARRPLRVSPWLGGSSLGGGRGWVGSHRLTVPVLASTGGWQLGTRPGAGSAWPGVFGSSGRTPGAPADRGGHIGLCQKRPPCPPQGPHRSASPPARSVRAAHTVARAGVERSGLRRFSGGRGARRDLSLHFPARREAGVFPGLTGQLGSPSVTVG